jgi:hypothetical protein
VISAEDFPSFATVAFVSAAIGTGGWATRAASAAPCAISPMAPVISCEPAATACTFALICPATPSTRDVCSARLRSQALDDPVSALAPVAQPVVQPVAPPLPELHGLRRDP